MISYSTYKTLYMNINFNINALLSYKLITKASTLDRIYINKSSDGYPLPENKKDAIYLTLLF